MSKNDITGDSIVTKQYSESYGKEQPKLDATVFVYRHKTTNRIQAHYIEVANLLSDDDQWEHLASIEPRMWIEAHYDDEKKLNELLNVLIECDEAMKYMSEYDIPLCLPESVKQAIACANGGK